MHDFENPQVAAVFAAYPPSIRDKLMFLRQLIFDTAKSTAGIGEVQETLKWDQPSYLTPESKSGTTIRIDWIKPHSKPGAHAQYAIYFHCQTNLVDTFRTLFPSEFRYQGNRSIVFDERDEIAVDALRHCIEMALTYHSHK
jgi:Domain of unknown function (DU1801)